MKRLREFLALERAGQEPDDPATTESRRPVIREKRFLEEFYRDVYAFFVSRRPRLPDGVEVECGSGAGFFKEFLPGVVTSDVMGLRGVDEVISALELPYDDDSVRAIYMLDVFHHLSDPARFLSEAARCLKKGGRILMVEPANTLWGRFVYRNFHHEPFEPGAVDWCLPDHGPLSTANGALPWIVFQRDRARFQREFPSLAVEELECFGPLTYLFSGGVSMRRLAPDFSYPAFRLLERALSVFNPWIGMFLRIVVVKN
jgi:SAM-dependent methyltransferase